LGEEIVFCFISSFLATFLAGLIIHNALIVARAFVIQFVEPYLFAKISLIPDTDNTFLIAQPAIIQVHSLAG